MYVEIIKKHLTEASFPSRTVKKELPTEVLKELALPWAKKEIKDKGFVQIGVDRGGDASESYFVVPLSKIIPLIGGKFDEEIVFADLGENVVLEDHKNKLAWVYLGVID